MVFVLVAETVEEMRLSVLAGAAVLPAAIRCLRIAFLGMAPDRMT